MQIKLGLETSYNLLNNSKFTCTPINFGRPSYWVLLATALFNQEIDKAKLNLKDDQLTYLRTINFSKYIFKEELTSINRTDKHGQNYSTLAPLTSEEVVNDANEIINSCIRFNIGDLAKKPTSAQILSNIVGELHDNVWSHAFSTGFSLFQKTRSYDQYYLEFAIADRGCGFLKELQRVQIAVKDDQEAILWCLEEGNTSKKEKEDDGWTQQLPPDVIGNPMGGNAAYNNGNHHQGLGLAKLKEMIVNAGGTLNIASGNQLYTLKKGAEEWDDISNYPWEGVAISFVIPLNNLENLEKKRNIDEEESKSLDELEELFE